MGDNASGQLTDLDLWHSQKYSIVLNLQEANLHVSG